MIKQFAIAVALVQLSVQAFAICIYNADYKLVCTHEASVVLPAKDARNILMNHMYQQHVEAIDWWLKEINSRIEKESRHLNASTRINVTAASGEVQEYLALTYEDEGYHSELTPGWDMKKKMPDGRTYLSLSW